MGYIMKGSEYNSLEERWDWLLSQLVLDEMFMHEILMIMSKSCNDSIGTMGVSAKESRINLYYNKDFLKSLDDAEAKYVLKHEVFHCVLHHITTRLPEDPKQRMLWNIAADLAINCLIREDAGCYRPKDPKTGKPIGVHPLDEEFKFPEMLSMEQYVQLIKDKFGSDGQGKGQGDPNGQGQSGQGDPNGQDKGQALPDKGSFDSHDGWQESELADEIIRNKVEELANSDRSWGSMSSQMKDMILAAQRSKVNWRKQLRHFLGQLPSRVQTPTFKKPNRRFGYPFSGKKREYTDRKLVAIDTSGSIADKELAQFLTEMNRLAETQPVDLCLFDWAITQEPRPYERKHTKYEFTGRGGTNFQPVMELAAKKRYQSIIMLTDGEASAPDFPKGVKDILWVITGGKNRKPPVDWGRVVHIDVD